MNAWRYESLEADTLVPVRYMPFATTHFFFSFPVPTPNRQKNKKWKKISHKRSLGTWPIWPCESESMAYETQSLFLHLYLWQIIQKGKAPPPTPTPISFPNVSFSYAIGFGIWSELNWNVDPISCVSWACHGNVTYHSHSHLFNVIMTFDKRREKYIIQKMEWNKIK